MEEESTEKKAPPASWPDSGSIEVSRAQLDTACSATDIAIHPPQFEKFSAKYGPDSEDVLHDLSLTIKAGEKVSSNSESHIRSVADRVRCRSASSARQAVESPLCPSLCCDSS